MVIKAKSRGVFALLLVVAFVALSMSTTAFAASGDKMDFSISPNLPANQTNSGLGYFDVMVEPESKQTLSLTAKNLSNKEITLEVEAISASTTPKGSINYVTAGIKDETMKHPFSELASVPEEMIVVPANSTKDIEINVVMPKEEYDGIILGGIRVKDITARLEKEQELENNTSGENTSGSSVELINEYEYVIGIVLRENNKEISPNFELVDVDAELVNHYAAIVATFRNPQPDAVKYAVYSAEIMSKGTDEALFSIQDKEIDMAPNSVMNYEFVDEAGFGVDAGVYTIKAQFEYQDDVWEFERDFTIEAAEVSAVNNAAVNQQVAKSQEIPLWVILAILAVLLLIALVIVLIIKVSKNKKD